MMNPPGCVVSAKTWLEQCLYWAGKVGDQSKCCKDYNYDYIEDFEQWKKQWEGYRKNPE